MLPLLNKKAIRNQLTIRYNPLEKPSIPKANWVDFQTKYSDVDGTYTQNLLMDYIIENFSKKNTPIIVSLSGGIDSTLCLALLRRSLPHHKITGITAIFEQSIDESKEAKVVAEKFEADFKIIPMKSIFSTLPELIGITKLPKWNTYNHVIAKIGKKYGKIFATGDGADEIFGGYTFRYNKFLNLTSEKDNWKKRVINYLDCHNRDWVPDQSAMFHSSVKFDWNNIYKYLQPYFSNKLEPMNQVMLADFNGKLIYDFIPTSNEICRKYKLYPAKLFLHPQIISYARHLPINQKYDFKTQKGKLILRKISKRLAIKHLDEKKGFSPNLWLDWEEKGETICESYLMKKDSHIFTQKIINYNWIKHAFNKVKQDNDIRYLNRLISILALEIWIRIFITKEIKITKELT